MGIISSLILSLFRHSQLEPHNLCEQMAAVGT